MDTIEPASQDAVLSMSCLSAERDGGIISELLEIALPFKSIEPPSPWQ